MKNHAEALASLGINPRLLLIAARGGRMNLTSGVAIAIERNNPSVLQVEIGDKYLPMTKLVFEQTPQGIETSLEIPNAGRSGGARVKPNEKLLGAVTSYLAKQLARPDRDAQNAFASGDFTRSIVRTLTGESVNLDDSRPGYSLREQSGQLRWGQALLQAAVKQSTPVVPHSRLQLPVKAKSARLSQPVF